MTPTTQKLNVRLIREHAALDSPEMPGRAVMDLRLDLADQAVTVALLREQVRVHVGHSECQEPLEALAYEVRVLDKLLGAIHRAEHPSFEGFVSAHDQHVDDYSYAYRITLSIEADDDHEHCDDMGQCWSGHPTIACQ